MLLFNSVQYYDYNNSNDSKRIELAKQQFDLRNRNSSSTDLDSINNNILFEKSIERLFPLKYYSKDDFQKALQKKIAELLLEYQNVLKVGLGFHDIFKVSPNITKTASLGVYHLLRLIIRSVIIENELIVKDLPEISSEELTILDKMLSYMTPGQTISGWLNKLASIVKLAFVDDDKRKIEDEKTLENKMLFETTNKYNMHINPPEGNMNEIIHNSLNDLGPAGHFLLEILFSFQGLLKKAFAENLGTLNQALSQANTASGVAAVGLLLFNSVQSTVNIATTLTVNLSETWRQDLAKKLAENIIQQCNSLEEKKQKSADFIYSLQQFQPQLMAFFESLVTNCFRQDQPFLLQGTSEGKILFNEMISFLKEQQLAKKTSPLGIDSIKQVKIVPGLVRGTFVVTFLTAAGALLKYIFNTKEIQEMTEGIEPYALI